jgi:hypothetical protein
VKRRTWIAFVSALLLNSFALAQTSSHFDLSGNVIFSGAKLANAPSASTQIDSFGWQTSGVTHLNRWLGLTSQFGSGYASSNSLQLIGYTGPGTISHYSMLVGPRITIPTHSRVSPFVEGLVGADRASTKLDSNGVSVTGREMQLAYSVGGGTQINFNRRFGVNVEAEYLGTQHSLAFTGWQPANFQVSAGIVIRMFSRAPQIAEQRPMSSPTTAASAQPQVPTPSAGQDIVPAQTQIARFQEGSAIQPAVATNAMGMASNAAASQPAIAPAPAVTANPVSGSAPVMEVKIAQPTVVAVPQPAPKPVVAVAPVPAAANAPPAVAVVASMPAPQAVVQAQPQQPQPMSLGEYARRLREQKQREHQQQQ